MMTCVTILAYRFRKARLTNHTSESLRATRPLLRRYRSARKLPAVALCASLLTTASVVLGEGADGTPTATLSRDSAKTHPQLRAAMSYKIAMSPQPGGDQLDRDIETVQRRIREAPEPRPFLEKLGWLYVAKARSAYDPGFYKLAEHCAAALEVADPKSPEAMLLRGHVFISFHRFAEAEALARELVKQRALPFDYGLLGDALMEQGRLTEAVSAYQNMVDLRPDLQSYSRVAYMRWLKGDSTARLKWPAWPRAPRARSIPSQEPGRWLASRSLVFRLVLSPTRRRLATQR